MGINERVLNILSLGCVDDIIIDAPFFIDSAFMNDFNISIVAEGIHSTTAKTKGDPFEIPKALNKFKTIDSKNDFTSDHLIDRIKQSEETIKSALARKKLKQNTYYQKEENKTNKTAEL